MTIENAISRAKDGIINLGCANGWLEETNQMYKALREHKVENSGTQDYIGRCYSEYTFEAKIGETVYKVVYTVDSGD